MVTRAELLKLLASLPPECEGCGAPLSGDICEYCSRAANAPTTALDEPPDIHKTNASDDPCPFCQLVHSTDPNARLICRCLYCGQVGPIAMSTSDAALGVGVVCHRCCQGAAPTGFGEMGGGAAVAPVANRAPWES